MTDLYWFSDEHWARIAPLLPKNTRGLKHVDDRQVLSGIMNVLKSGGLWVDCPAEYGAKKNLLQSLPPRGRARRHERYFRRLLGAMKTPTG
jgi:transposase